MNSKWLLGLVALSGTALAGDLPVDVAVFEEGLVIEQYSDAASAELKVFQGDLLVLETVFDPSEGLALTFSDMLGQAYPDGAYSFSVTYSPHVLGDVPADEKGLQNGRDLVPLTVGQGGVVSGQFRLINGAVPMAQDEINHQIERIEQ